MYTFSRVISDEKNLTTRRRVIVVEFINAEELLSQSFSFGLATTADEIKKTIKNYLEELNFVQGEIKDITIISPEETEPTQAELDKTEWDSDVAKLKKAQELIDCGVTFTAPQLSALATLRTKIATNFKASYLG